MIQVAHIGLHCRWLWFMIVDTFQSLNESYLLFHIPMRFLMVHFICGFSLSTNKWLSFFATGDWYDRSNICSHFQGIAWQVTFWQPFCIIYKYWHVLHLSDNRDLKIHRQRREREHQKSSWFKKQNSNSARASRFFVHFFSVTARPRVKQPNFTFNGGRKQATTECELGCGS